MSACNNECAKTLIGGALRLAAGLRKQGALKGISNDNQIGLSVVVVYVVPVF